MELLHPDHREEWDAFALREPMFALLQSWEWGEIKERMGWKVFRLAVRDGDALVAAAQVLVKHLPINQTSIAYVPRGPIGRWDNPEASKFILMALHQVAASENALFLRVEPPLLQNIDGSEFLCQNGFHKISWTNQPRSTIVLDLTPDLNTIFNQIRKNTRRRIKDGTRKGLRFRIGSEADLPTFYELMKVTAERAGFTSRPYKYYQTEFQSLAAEGCALMMLAYDGDRPIAAHIIYKFGSHAAFFHQASANDTSGLNPNYVLVWEEIKWLKEKGCCTYDLWGIPDEVGDIVAKNGELPRYERHDGLWGVYQFKAGFGKNVVVFPGAYDHVCHRLPYLAASPVLSQSIAMEQLSTWINPKRVGNLNSPLLYAVEELKFIKSFRDLDTLSHKIRFVLSRKAGSLYGMSKAPLSLQLEPTNWCNVNCICCSAPRSSRKKGYMDWDLFREIIDDAKQLNIQRIRLYLHGESTLHPRIVDMIRYIKTRELTVHVTTNGMLLDREKSEAILRSGISFADHFTFSILGDTEETHNKIMRRSDLKKIRANIDAFLDARNRLGINGPVIETIFHSMPENKYEEEGYQDRWSHVVDHVKYVGRISRSFSDYKKEDPAIVRTQRCRVIQERMTVFWNGDVTICAQDVDGDYVLGSLSKQSMQEIWNSEQLSFLRKINREKRFSEFPFCAKCDL